MFQLDEKQIKNQLLELIRLAATDLPKDVVDSRRSVAREPKMIFHADNRAGMAAGQSAPIHVHEIGARCA